MKRPLFLIFLSFVFIVLGFLFFQKQEASVETHQVTLNSTPPLMESDSELESPSSQIEKRSSPREAFFKEQEEILVKMMTNLGDVTFRLFPQEAPLTVENFLNYVESDFFNGTIFHRVVPGFVVQGGGFTANMTAKQTMPPIVNEATNTLSNRRGTLAMARTSVRDSATSQFFINLSDQNTFLDYQQGENGQVIQDGYAVFGEVVEGMDLVDQMSDPNLLKPNSSSPRDPVLIKKMVVLQGSAPSRPDEIHVSTAPERE